MPYYLVTQTLLVEADNPSIAAEKAFKATLEQDHLVFEVRLDHENINQVVLAADRRDEMLRPITGLGAACAQTSADIRARPSGLGDVGVERSGNFPSKRIDIVKRAKCFIIGACATAMLLGSLYVAGKVIGFP